MGASMDGSVATTSSRDNRSGRRVATITSIGHAAPWPTYRRPGTVTWCSTSNSCDSVLKNWALAL